MYTDAVICVLSSFVPSIDEKCRIKKIVYTVDQQKDVSQSVHAYALVLVDMYLNNTNTTQISPELIMVAYAISIKSLEDGRCDIVGQMGCSGFKLIERHVLNVLEYRVNVHVSEHLKYKQALDAHQQTCDFCRDKISSAEPAVTSGSDSISTPTRTRQSPDNPPRRHGKKRKKN